MEQSRGSARRAEETAVLATPRYPSAIFVRELALEVVAGPDVGQKAALSRRALTVGSHPSNDLVLSDPAVSRFHFRVVADDRGCRVIDLRSTNGTFVGGVRIEAAYLADGGRIAAGKSTIAAGFGPGQTEIELSTDDAFGEAVGCSVRMREVFALARRAAAADATILILGETGTGKDVLARAIHAHGDRTDRPFVVCDCAAVPDSLIESALFGHVRGAFTGADADRTGVFERASGGTLFLDEIGELPLSLQPKLLRALDGKAVTPVGGSREVPADARVIAATNRNLREMVDRESFRADLFYRLAVVTIEVPPLRERPEDIPLLAAHFLRDLLARDGRDPTAIADQLQDALAPLRRYRWPGNVRELRNVIERAAALADPGELARDLESGTGALRASVARSMGRELPLKAAREQFDREYLRDLLAATEGDLRRASEIAGVHQKSLERLLRKYRIDRS